MTDSDYDDFLFQIEEENAHICGCLHALPFHRDIPDWFGGQIIYCPECKSSCGMAPPSCGCDTAFGDSCEHTQEWAKRIAEMYLEFVRTEK